MKKKIKKMFYGTVLLALGIGAVRYVKGKIQASESNLHRQSQYYDALLDWIDNMQAKRKISTFLEEKGYRTIAVYGKGTLGFLLYRELKDTEIHIEYFVDQAADEYTSDVEGIPVIRKDEISDRKEVDAMIVTPIHAYKSIESDLKQMNISMPILSLTEAILEAK